MRSISPVAVLVLLLLGCVEETPTSTGSASDLPERPPRGASSTPGDQVQWTLDGVLEFVDDGGTRWRLEREGPWNAPGLVRIWRNGVLEGEVDLFAGGPYAENYRWREPFDEWADTRDDGSVIATSMGIPSAGGGGCDPESLGCIAPDGLGWMVAPMGGSVDWARCTEDQDTFEGHARTAIAGFVGTGAVALIQLVTKAPLTNVTRRVAAATATATFYSVRSFFDWVECLKLL